MGGGKGDEWQRLVADAPDANRAGLDGLNAALDRLLRGRTIDPPAPPAQADEDRLAAFGFLRGLRPIASLAPVAPLAPVPPLAPKITPDASEESLARLPPVLDAAEQTSIAASHRTAVALIAQKKYSAD